MALLGIRIRVLGKENIPQGAAIIAPNHISFLDPPMVCIALPEPAHFMARKSLFDSIIGRCLYLGNAIPVERGQADLQALRGVLRALREGRKVVIFPEGTRSKTGALGELKLGPAICALRTGAPIVPVWVSGHEQLWPIGKRLPKLWGSCTVQFGAPIETKSFANTREGAEQLTAALCQRLEELRNAAKPS